MSDIRPGLSDPHRGGHSVAVLDFASGDPLVYKPKDLRLEQHFQRLVAGVNRHFPDHPLHEVQVLTGDGPYGFTSFVAHRPCPREQLPGFYVAAGRLLALLYLLGATDAHPENVIAAGSSPALIDSETLFHTDTSGEPTGMLSDSVLRTGLLPGWLLIGPQQEAYDPSALGVSVPEDAAAAPGWAHVNTDDMIWTRVPRQTSVPPSLPVDDPADNPLPDHVEHLVAGYRDIHLACAEPTFRDMLLDSVTGCRGLPQRLVLRSTRIYGVIGQRALSARALTSANARAFELERLSRVALVGGERDPAWAVFQAELHDMENLDVPYFEHELGCDVVVGALGPISGLVTGDATRVAAERILALDAGELSWQEHLIRGSVRARFLDADQDTAPPATRQAAPLAPTVPALLATIERAAVRRQAGAPPTWLTLSLLPDGKHLQLGTVGDGWYDGRAGIAAVQGWAATCGDDPALTRQAAQTGEPVLERLRHADPHTRSRYLRALGPGATGVGGLLRWLAPGDREHLLADVPASLIKRDRTYDVIGGVAGLIGPLAAAGFPRPDCGGGRRAPGAGQLPNGGWPSRMGSRPLTGLAHGAAGCGLALLQAGAVLGRTDLVDAGAAAFDYEARLYDEQLGNWPDFRDQRVGTVPMVAWCHGAAGIGLSRVRALQILPEHPDATTWQEHLRAAMTTTATAPPTATDHLCCGLTGRAAVLRIAGRAMAEPQWLAAADDLTTVVADRCAATGRFRLPMDIPAEGTCTGLMTGVAGIAAHLLSLSVHDDLSALLL
ncbi:MAG: type 2 lantipeptide synthetase LanM family protein [Micrococcales bacterium]|nr:type 2 lantipeptide synthetase LanM family protein [Micrococcales bacterium]